MGPLLRVSAFIDKLNEWIGRSVAWLGLVAVLVCTANALGRYLFNVGSNAWLEMQWYLNSAVFLLVAGWTLKRNEHVRIDVIAGRLSARAQAWIDIVGSIFMLLPAVTIIAWYSWPSLHNSWVGQEYSSDPGGLIRWPVKLVLPVGFAVLALQTVAEIVRRAAMLAGALPLSTQYERPAT